MQSSFICTQKQGNTLFTFPGKTKVLSTSPLNGGLTTHLTHALNIDCLNGSYTCDLLGDTYEEDLSIHTRSMGLDPSTTTALSTAAWTELAAVQTLQYRELSVTAYATGGIDHNAMSAGDPSSYYEENGHYEMLPPGTINIFLYINQELTDAAMTRALVVCSEAKAAAVSELLIRSCYSEEIATGSGTDGTVIASSMEGTLTLTDASGHSKLGELIGKTVKAAVKEALLKQTGACGPRQLQISERISRFGITNGTIWEFYLAHQDFFEALHIHFDTVSAMEQLLLMYNRGRNLVQCISLYVHLMDQTRWNLVMEADALREGTRVLCRGLYWKKGQFLGDAYPTEAWALLEKQHFSLKEQLMALLILYIALANSDKKAP